MLICSIASRYSDIGAVVGIVPSHVSFPALTMSAASSSWTFNGEEVAYIPMPWSAVPAAIKHDLHTAFSIMPENEEAAKSARIQVEKINGPILLMSATRDEMWPSTEMSEIIIQALTENNFKDHYEHIAIEGGHNEPLDHYEKIFNFLDQNFK